MDTYKEIDQATMKMVKFVASQYTKYGFAFEDLVQEGLFGVLEAEKRFDETRGVQFTTYASYWAKKRILLFIEKESKYQYNSIELKEEILSDDSIDIEKKIEEPSETIPENMFPEGMPELEKKIIRYLYEENKSLSQIAEKLGLRREKIRQQKQKAERRLRIFVKKDTD